MFPPIWKEPATWKIIIGAVLAILNEVMGLEIPAEVVWPVVLLILGWVFKDVAESIAIRTALIKKEGFVAAVRYLDDLKK